mmetsp:Transcript_20449/g.16898  ORF Transcript_20449/g.16898 Transcript_20449/m.16898 type:complete len:131 (+) Transcript_20449:1702-2094(+)
MNSNQEGKTHDDLEPIHSYVTFLSADDADEFKSLIKKKNFKCIGCIPCCALCGCPAWEESELLFGYSQMQVKSVDYQPSDIIWENLDVKPFEKRCRSCIGAVILTIVILLSILLVLLAKWLEYKAKQNFD